MTHSARLSALMLPVALIAPARHACRPDNHPTPRVEQSQEIVMSNAEEHLRTLLATYETALNAGDAGRIEQLYTEDGVFMPAGFPTASGRKAVRGAYDAIFSNIRIAIHFTVDELTI